jgi:N-acetylgalactosamine kinase
MGSESCPKVCFAVNGVPAINRALATYERCGIRQHVVVVGSLAEQVIETVGGSFANVAYVYQKEQLGTAHALRCAMTGLNTIDDQADLLIAAGDRIIDQAVLERLFDLYYTNHAELAFVALRCRKDSGQGRVITDADGRPAAIVEMADIRQREVYRKMRAVALSGLLPARQALYDLLCETFFGVNREVNPAKAAKAFGPLWTRLAAASETVSAAELLGMIPEAETVFSIPTADGVKKVSPMEAACVEYGNTSIYLVKARLLKGALARLDRKNAQGEEYLSDLVGIVYRDELAAGRKPRVAMLPVDDTSKVLGFNNPAELLEIEKLLHADGAAADTPTPDADYFMGLGDWRKAFAESENRNGALHHVLLKLYGKSAEIRERQTAIFRQMLECAARRLPDDAVIGIVRSPGRLNVMGRHVDHQGGNCNLMTIGFETVMLVHPRSDDRVVLEHCDPEHFASSEFSIAELVADLPWEDWNSVVNSPKLAKMISEYGVDWSQYVKAAILRLQKKFITRPLRGMDLFIGGNVPMAAGLSSSSSLIVGAAEAAVAVNRLDTFPSQLVTLCGEGEWFVGTRGGSADHAAVKMGRQGSVVKVKFFNFGVEEVVPFPEGHTMVVCDSGIKARKSGNAKDQFNHRVSCYRIGFKLICRYLPQYRSLLHHLRDVNVRTLAAPLSEIYRILLMLPESATLPELQAMLPDEDLAALCAGHRAPADGRYPIRGVVLFGLGEAERSAAYAGALKAHDLGKIGRMMKISHDGDRVVRYDADWQPTPFLAPVDNAYLLDRLADLQSGDPERVIASQLIWQAGRYACSLPEIDLMVDIADRTPGVVGAQLAGAGLGGCMMVLAAEEAIPELRRQLNVRYYEPSGIEPSILVCRPVAGAGLMPCK